MFLKFDINRKLVLEYKEEEADKTYRYWIYSNSPRLRNIIILFIII